MNNKINKKINNYTLNTKHYSLSEGFSFVGVLVTTFIVSIGLISVFTTSNSALRSTSNAGARLVASGLAQEGIEIVRDIRSANRNWEDWEWYSTTTPMTHPIGTSEEYCVQYDSTAFSSCGATESPLKLDSGTFLYQYSSGDDTSYYRKITLTRVSNYEVKVESQVRWQIKGSSRSLTVEDRLWKWR